MAKVKARKAGTYAEQRYQQGLRNWRAKIRPILGAALGPFIVIGVAVLVFKGDHLSWFAGAITGAFVGAWIWVRETPPRYVEQWRDGAEGERKTEKTLRPLERAGWHVVHDVAARCGNYDHIVVGRAGVFLLDSKNLQGIVEMHKGVPRLRRRLDPESDVRFNRIRQRALKAAASLKGNIEQRTGHRIWVQAVVVFWAEFPEGLVEDERCVFVHGPRLRAWVESRPDWLSQDTTDEIAAAVEKIAAHSEHDAAALR